MCSRGSRRAAPLLSLTPHGASSDALLSQSAPQYGTPELRCVLAARQGTQAGPSAMPTHDAPVTVPLSGQARRDCNSTHCIRRRASPAILSHTHTVPPPPQFRSGMDLVGAQTGLDSGVPVGAQCSRAPDDTDTHLWYGGNAIHVPCFPGRAAVSSIDSENPHGEGTASQTGRDVVQYLAADRYAPIPRPCIVAHLVPCL